MLSSPFFSGVVVVVLWRDPMKSYYEMDNDLIPSVFTSLLCVYTKPFQCGIIKYNGIQYNSPSAISVKNRECCNDS